MKAIRLVAILSLVLTMGLIGMDTAHASATRHAPAAHGDRPPHGAAASIPFGLRAG